MFTSDTLNGKRILITGGGSGLGLAMAKQFATHGAQIVICGRDEKKFEHARQEIPGLTAIRCDVRDYDAVGAMFAELRSKSLSPNCLVNNAAGNFLSPSEDLTPNGFRTVIDIVLNGSFNCASHFGKECIAAKTGGTMLNIVATYIQSGSSFVLPSACAKAGVAALTTSLAYEWAEYGIRANAIAPGPFPTEGAWKRLVPDPQFEEVFRKRIPLQRFGKPEELSNLALFLLSDLSSYINGEIISIDGGEQLNSGQFNFVTQLMPRPQLKALFQKMRKAE